MNNYIYIFIKGEFLNNYVIPTFLLRVILLMLYYNFKKAEKEIVVLQEEERYKFFDRIGATRFVKTEFVT